MACEEPHETVRYETVDHPPHYNQGAIEHVAYVEDRGWGVGYLCGQVTKYLHRMGDKPGANRLEDARKAAWYANRLVEYLTRTEPKPEGGG